MLIRHLQNASHVLVDHLVQSAHVALLLSRESVRLPRWRPPAENPGVLLVESLMCAFKSVSSMHAS
jgi:hypothetical protein